MWVNYKLFGNSAIKFGISFRCILQTYHFNVNSFGNIFLLYNITDLSWTNSKFVFEGNAEVGKVVIPKIQIDV